MDDTERVNRIEKAVVDECELLLASDAFDTWKGAESIRHNDLVVVNNSFFAKVVQRSRTSIIWEFDHISSMAFCSSKSTIGSSKTR